MSERKLLCLPDSFKGVVSDKRRIMRHLISAEVIDRDGEVLAAKGVKTATYLDSNPVVFLNHQARELPVARSLDVTVAHKEVEATTQFAGLEQLHDLAERTYRMYRDKFMHAWSVGFSVLKASPAALVSGQQGRSILEWELLEYSAVGIPSNPAAVSRMLKDFRGAGLITLPDGASEDDLGKALGTVPLAKYWAVAEHIVEPTPAPGADHRRKGTRMDKQDLDEIEGLLVKVTKPTLDDVEALKGQVETLEAAARAAAKEAAARKAREPDDADPSGLVLSDGQRFPFGRGGSRLAEKIGGNRAPGVIHSRGEQPLRLAHAIHSLKMGDKSLAPLAWDLSAKLAQCGFGTDPRSLLLPLGDAALFRVPGHEATIDEVGRVSKQAYPIDVDPGELDTVRKQFYGAKAAQDPFDDTLGGTMIALPAQGEPITALRAATVVLQAGARSVPLPPQGSLIYPTSTGDASLQWLGPNASITESTVPTGALNLSAKKAAGLCKLPNEFLRFSRGVAEAMIRESLIAKLARTIDLAALEGTGGSLQPEGLTNALLSAANTPTVGRVTMYTGAGVSTTLGNTFRPEDALRMIAMIEEANDQDGPTGFLMRPLMWAGLANKRADAVTAGDAAGVWMFPVTRGDLGNAVRKELSGVTVLTTTAMSKLRTENNGAVTGLTYLVCGNFRSMIVANVGVMELALSTDAGFGNDQTWVRVIGHSDVGLAHPESFTLYDQILIPT